MARNGTFKLDDMTVKQVSYGKLKSTLTVTDGTTTVTVESTAQFPQRLRLRPDDMIDVKINYDEGG